MEIKEINTFCRICLKNNHIYSNIFYGHPTDSNPIYQVINDVYDLQICVGDGFPEHVCQKCLSIVRKFEIYKRKAQVAKRRLISWKERIDLECASVPAAVKQDEQEIVATQIARKETEIRKKKDDTHSAIHSVIHDNSLPENQFVTEQEEVEKTEDDRDDESVDSVFLVIQEEEDEHGEGNGDIGHSAVDNSMLPHNQEKLHNRRVRVFKLAVDRTRAGEQGQEIEIEDREIVKNSPFAEECAGSESSHGNELMNFGGRESEKERFVELERVIVEESLDVSAGDEVTCRQSRQKGKQNSLACSVCSKKVQSSYDLEVHMKLHTTEALYTCHVCDRTFGVKNNLKNHILTHQKDKPLKCSQCEYICNRIDQLKAHAVTHQNVRPLKCFECDYRCETKDDLKMHIVTHREHKGRFRKSAIAEGIENRLDVSGGDELPWHQSSQKSKQYRFACSVCSKQLRSNSELVAHLRSHTKEKPFQCQVCDKSYAQKSSFKEHLLTHLADKHLKCPQCDYRTNKGGCLRRHMITHQTVKHLKCSKCDYRSYSLEYLKGHMVSHQSERPYKCSECEYRCKRKYDLKHHMKVHR